jgi:hypothetical protein
VAHRHSLYVYGVVPAQAREPEGTGIADAPLELIRAGELAALVSTLEDEVPQLDRDALTQHARVLEAALGDTTVLPMRFGVVVQDEAQARAELLSRHEEELLEQLAELTGKVELKLRASYVEEALLRDVIGEHPEIARLRDVLRGLPAEASYYERIRLGEMVTDAVQGRRSQDAAALLDVLEPLAHQVSIAESAHERIVLDASFLVARDRIDRFDGAVDELGQRYATRMRMRYTGPLPAHSFVALQEG